MSPKGFAQAETARRVKNQIKKIAREEIEKKVPPNRIAVVLNIDTEARTAVVQMIGDPDPITLPYLSAVPSFQGQEVVVGGGVHDRHIIDVKGSTALETDVSNMRDATDPAYITLRLATDFFTADATGGRFPFVNTWAFRGEAITGDIGTNGVVINEAGDYEVGAQIGFGGNGASGDNNVSVWLACLPASTGVQFDIVSGNGWGFNQDTLQVRDLIHLDRGDKVYLNYYNAQDHGYWVNQCRLMVRLIARDAVAPPLIP